MIWQSQQRPVGEHVEFESTVATVGADRPIGKQLLAYPVVLPELPVWAREWFADHLPRGVEASAVMPPFRPSVICSHYSTLKTIVQKSNAVSALTELSLQRNPHAREFAVIDFTGIRPSSNPGIVTLKKRTLSPAALRLIEELVAVADQR